MATTTVNGDSKPLKVAIVGGGPGGLALALGLQQHDHLEVHVFESKPKLGDIGASVTLSTNALAALKSIAPAMQKVLDKCLTNFGTTDMGPRGPRIYAGGGERCGEYLGRAEFARPVFASHNIHRATFVTELEAELDRTAVHLDSGVRGYTQDDSGVHLELSNGSKETFDALFGADGLRSVVRASMFGSSPSSEPTFTGAVAYRGFVPFADAERALGKERAGEASFMFGPGLLLLGQPADHGRMYNMVTCTTGHERWSHEKWTIPVEPEELRNALSDWGTPGDRWLELINKPGMMKWAIFQSAFLPYFNDGSVALPTH
ncbi:Salicylate hydroxylase [Cyphellophora attinorum]|uniref:Salicylate hydroxylase n=1 Tax=Cyphellophora attinorum TaxID=1664694 RepID=A0A0N0NMV2_9EURO|nr:Salicylate hydroxylase [Phialophora attinorum]KPI40778.1 Salicylate hydroxylase [Phialophora attinorum]